MTDLQDIRLTLQRIEDVQREILARLAVPSRLSPECRKTLESLLPAIGGKWGSAPFTVAEVLANPVLKLLSGGLNSHKLGSLFAKAAHEKVGELRLERLEKEHQARLWRVVRWSF